MPIGPDGRIIRRRVRYFTPVNTNAPSESKWWNARNFTIAGFWINLVIFPI